MLVIFLTTVPLFGITFSFKDLLVLVVVLLFMVLRRTIQKIKSTYEVTRVHAYVRQTMISLKTIEYILKYSTIHLPITRYRKSG